MKRIRSIAALAGALTLLAGGSAVAHPGDADPTFSQDGFAQVDLFSSAESGGFPSQEPAQPVGIGPGGEIVLAANTRYDYNCNTYCARSDSFIALARLLPNGTLDASFAGDGTFESNFGLGNVRGIAYAMQPDGKVLVAGSAYYPGSGSFVARLKPDGALDPSFAAGGVLTFESIGVGAMALAPDGRIVVGGDTRGAEFQPGFYGEDDILLRLLPNGALDPSFGDAGQVTVDLTRIDDINRLALDGDGRILAAGTYDNGDRNEITSLIRVLPDGSLDSGFSGDGSLQVDLATSAISAERLSALVIDGRNRPILSISSVVTGPGVSPYRRALIRYNGDGAPDTGFGPEGEVFIEDVPDESTDAVDQLRALVLDDQGRMLVGGGPRLLVGRRVIAGTADFSFGDSGWIQLDPPQGAFATGLLVDPAGRVIVVGGGGITGTQVARLRTDGGPPDDLDADGVVDNLDRCPSSYAPASGCPSSARTLSIHRHRDRVSGELVSDSEGCVDGARIGLFKKRKGRDSRVRSTIVIDPAGTSALWEVPRPARPGRFYARVRCSFAATAGACAAARSRTIRLRSGAH